LFDVHLLSRKRIYRKKQKAIFGIKAIKILKYFHTKNETCIKWKLKSCCKMQKMQFVELKIKKLQNLKKCLKSEDFSK
jgi:hypothetical protein